MKKFTNSDVIVAGGNMCIVRPSRRKAKAASKIIRTPCDRIFLRASRTIVAATRTEPGFLKGETY